MRSVRSVVTASAMLLGLCVCAIALLLTAPRGAAAAPDRTITVAIAAQVEGVDDRDGLLCVPLAPGDIITGTYTYTLGAPDTNDLDFVADYAYSAPPNGIALELGGATTGTDPSNTNFIVELVNDHPSGLGDNYLLRSFSNLPLSCGAPVDHIAWQLDDPTGEALSNTKLTKMPPRLGDFQSIFGLTVEGSDPFSGSFYFVRAHVTSATRVK
jgi:hypothetical protein